MGTNKSSTGLQENIGGLLAYLVGFVSGIILLLVEKENQVIRFHAMQSTVVFGGFFLLGIVLNFIPVIGTLISILLAPVSFILWIYLMIKGYQGGRYHLPIAGPFAEEQLKKF
ncbi:hypothetical protein E4663_16625 [Halobacillus salinus]|uniref:DUF4870 domain-containing protein n=2 Tax=Halobacillus salinus TaxID=192814 RepID=A0A4Z0GW45_9BACI|nr:hypothetical protein E4663_16625 [Halobacillus salinus]